MGLQVAPWSQNSWRWTTKKRSWSPVSRWIFFWRQINIHVLIADPCSTWTWACCVYRWTSKAGLKIVNQYYPLILIWWCWKRKKRDHLSGSHPTRKNHRSLSSLVFMANEVHKLWSLSSCATLALQSFMTCGFNSRPFTKLDPGGW